MKVSLNELDTMSQKAALGAGRPWGLAQEAGRAVAVLESMRLPGAAALLTLLQETDGFDVNRRSCPILAGAHLADLGPIGEPVALEAIRSPLLLVPFAMRTGGQVSLSWGASQIIAMPEGVCATYVDFGLDPQPVRIKTTDVDIEPSHVTATGAVDIGDEIWEGLSQLAQRTYVPASEASRLRGAGAGLTDND